MSDIELYNIPKEELYWKKQEIADQIFKLSQKFRKASDKRKAEIESDIRFYADIVRRIDRRMQSLYI